MHGEAEVSGDFVNLTLGYPAFSQVLWNSWGEWIQQIQQEVLGDLDVLGQHGRQSHELTEKAFPYLRQGWTGEQEMYSVLNWSYFVVVATEDTDGRLGLF